MVRAARVIPLLATVSLVLGCPAGEGDEQAASETTGPSETGETGEACELPSHATPTDTALISITNERDVPIYVMPYSSFSCNYGKVEIEVGGEPVLWDHAGTYAYACDAELCGWGCSDGGAMGLIINPGAVAEVEWNGALWADTSLPEACAAELDCPNGSPTTCEVRELVEGDYLVRVNLSETCPVEDECMACTEGVCEVFFYEPYVNDMTESFEATATFPAGVQIAIN